MCISKGYFRCKDMISPKTYTEYRKAPRVLINLDFIPMFKSFCIQGLFDFQSMSVVESLPSQFHIVLPKSQLRRDESSKSMVLIVHVLAVITQDLYY